MSSPLSRPFSVFPSTSTSHSNTSSKRNSTISQLQSCPNPRCTYRSPLPSDLAIHNAIQHSSLGHSPITALNISPTPAFSDELEEGSGFPFVYSLERPQRHIPGTTPSAASSSSTSLATSSSLRGTTAQPPPVFTPGVPVGHRAPVKSFTASTSTSASTASTGRNWRGRFMWRRRGGKKVQKHIRRVDSTVMRCGRHGDEWLGCSGWRFWR